MGRSASRAAAGPRVALFGGSFNPIHLGHLFVAQEIAERCELDQVLFVPSAVPPHKCRPGIASPELRSQMVLLAIADNERFALSRVEIDREGVSYTADTLRLLLGQLGPGTQLYLIVGRDNAEDLSTWSRPEEVLRLASVVVADRSHEGTGGNPDLVKRMTILDTPRLAISSTEKKGSTGAPSRVEPGDRSIRRPWSPSASPASTSTTGACSKPSAW